MYKYEKLDLEELKETFNFLLKELKEIESRLQIVEDYKNFFSSYKNLTKKRLFDLCYKTYFYNKSGDYKKDLNKKKSINKNILIISTIINSKKEKNTEPITNDSIIEELYKKYNSETVANFIEYIIKSKAPN